MIFEERKLKKERSMCSHLCKSNKYVVVKYSNFYGGHFSKSFQSIREEELTKERGNSFSPRKYENERLYEENMKIEEEFKLNFFKEVIYKKICGEIHRNGKLIQKHVRAYLIKLKLKRDILVKFIQKRLSEHITNIQKNIRRFMFVRKHKYFLSLIKHSHYLILGNYKNDLIKNPKTMELIKYDRNFNDMYYYDFMYIKSLDKFVLFLDKETTGNGKIYVNFCAEGMIFNNFLYQSIRMANQIFYNIIYIKDKLSINTNLYTDNLKLSSEDRNKKRRYSMKEPTFIYSPIRSEASRGVITPILKNSMSFKTPKKETKKRVSFSEFVYESKY
jgi:hypothetical protein